MPAQWLTHGCFLSTEGATRLPPSTMLQSEWQASNWTKTTATRVHPHPMLRADDLEADQRWTGYGHVPGP